MQAVERSAVNERYFQCRTAVFEALQGLLSGHSDEAVRETFAGCSEGELAAIFDLYRQAVHQIRANSEMEVDAIFEEAQLLDKLTTLDQMAEQQEQQGPGGKAALAGQSLLQPEEALLTCRVDAKRAEHARLLQKLAQAEQQESELGAEVATLRTERDALVAALGPVQAHVQQAREANAKWFQREPLAAA